MAKRKGKVRKVSPLVFIAGTAAIGLAAGVGLGTLGVFGYGYYRMRARARRLRAFLDSLPGAAQTATPETFLPSYPAMWAVEQGLVSSPALDWGGGHGRDTNYFRSYGFETFLYDPYHQPELPNRSDFRFAQLAFVLDIIESPLERLRTLKQMASFLAPGAHVVLTTISDTRFEEMFGGAPPSPDAWERGERWARTNTGAYFRPFTSSELKELAKASGLIPIKAETGESDVILHARTPGEWMADWRAA